MTLNIAAAPVLTSATPADNTGAVNPGANIVLNFSGAVHAGSGYITISDGAMQTYMGRDGMLHTRMVGATDTRTISIADASQVSISGNQLTINLTADLKAGSSYSVQMGSGVLLGESGLGYAGLLDATKLNFTVGSAVAVPTAVVDTLSMYSSENPFITNIANQHFSGTFTGQLGSGEKVQVSIDGTTWHDATVSGNSWGYDSTISANGNLSARVTNSAGASSEVKSQDYVYDVAAPTVASMTLNKAALSAGESAVLTVVFSEKVSGLTASDFSAHNSTVSGVESSADGLTWTATVTMGVEGLSGGDVTLNSGAVKDAAGNYGPGTASMAAYTRGPASLAGVTAILNEDGGKSGIDHLISDNTPTVRLDIDGVSGLVKGDLIGIYDQASNALLGSYALTEDDLGVSGGDILVTLAHLEDGVHHVVARAIDAGGNTGTASTTALDFTLETVAPGVSSTNPTGLDPVEAGLQTIAITFDEDIDWASANGIVIESGGHEIVSLTFETPPPADLANPGYSYLSYDEGTRVLTVHLASALAAGASYSVQTNGVGIYDNAGNAYAGSDTLLNFRITEGGVLLPGAPTLAIIDTGTSDGVTANATISVTGLSASYWVYSVDGGETYSSQQVSDGDSARFTLPHDGVYAAGKIMVVQYDTTDQKSASGQFDFDVTLDTAAPVAGIDDANSFSHANTSVTGSFSGALGSGEHIEYSVDGGDWLWATSSGSSDGTWTASGLSLASASSTLAVRVADSAGNVADNYYFPSSTGPVYFGSSGSGEFTAGDGKVLLAGAGSDYVTLSGASTGYIDGGDGLDTLELNASLNLSTSAGLFTDFETLVLADNTTLTIGDFSNMEYLNLPSAIISDYTALAVEGDSSSHIDLTDSNSWHELTHITAALMGLEDLLTGHDIYVNTSAHLVLLVGDSTVHMSHSD